MKLKPYICLMLCLGLALSGCATTQKTIEDNYYYFLFATPLKEHVIWLQAKKGFDAACDELSIRCDWEGPINIDPLAMQDVIETGIAQHADAIITQGVVDEAMLTKAKDRKIPFMLVDSDMKTEDKFAYIGKDFHNQAKLLLQDVEQAYGKNKHLTIAIQVAEKGFQIALDQIAEVENVFKNHPGGYEIVSVSESKSDSVRAKKTWKTVLEEHDNINVAINFAGESASACYEIAKEMNKRDQMRIYGVDEMEETIQMIRDGRIDGSIVVSFYEYGYRSVKMLYDHVVNHKEPEEKSVEAKQMMVTKKNVDIYQKELQHE